MNNVTAWPETPQNNGLYSALPDPTSDSTFIDPSMFSNPGVDVSPLPTNPQFQQRLQNGAVRNPYQVSSMVPSKRPREDSTGAPLSRSQTPAQGQFGFAQGNHVGGHGPAQMAPQPLQVPSPFPHLQQQAGSANATPSPTLQNQHFRPPGAPPQRVQTVSPAQNPQGPGGQGPGAPQMSPMNFMSQGSPMAPAYNQNYGNQQFQIQPVQLSHNLQNRQQEAQRQYQMRLQQQMAQNNMVAAQRQQAGQMMGPGGPQHPGMQRGQANPAQLPNQHAQARAHLDSFLKNVSALMAKQGLPFNPQPVVAGRPVNLQQLYFAVMKGKGSQRVTATNSWPTIATMIGIHPQNFPTAPEELKQAYDQNLGPYEHAFILNKQREHMRTINPPQPAQMGVAPHFGPQMSPTKPMPPNAQHSMNAQQQQYLQQLQRTQAMQQQHMEQATPVKANAQMAGVNGWSSPQPSTKMHVNALQHRKSLSRQLEATPPRAQAPGFPSPSPGPVDKMRESMPPAATPVANGIPKPPDDTPDHGTEYQISSRKLTKTHGGYEVDPLGQMGEEIAKNKPIVPHLEEMGLIDIRALTLSLQSGIHSEMRLALDVLVRLSHEQRVQLELEKCDELIDVLIDCAEDQLDGLAEHNPEVSDAVDLTPYEDVVRNCRAEVHALQNIPEVGTLDYELDRRADRLIAISTILRNLSFFEFNHPLLASAIVLKFVSNAIRLIGTRLCLLRSQINTADFMKDLVTFLSNTSDKIVLPSREVAANILQFLCAFAPCPRPGNPVRFTPYNPLVHRYLPPAVDSLAKLLARDDPNRTYFGQIFALEADDEPPYDLLTRAFALAISVVPDKSTVRRSGEEKRVAEARKPYLMQGMLAGDLLASLAPGPENNLCRSWLEAEDGWAATLLRFSVFLCGNDTRPPPPQQGNRPQQRIDPDHQGFQLIIHRALSMLKRLGEKSKGETLVRSQLANGNGQHHHHRHRNMRADSESESDGGSDVDGDDADDGSEKEDMVTVVGGGGRWRVKADVLPKKEVLLGALLTPNIDQVALRQLCSFGGLDG
jgi:SWI/SNF chromatin-remodeling complex subunit SWI1